MEVRIGAPATTARVSTQTEQSFTRVHPEIFKTRLLSAGHSVGPVAVVTAA